MRQYRWLLSPTPVLTFTLILHFLYTLSFYTPPPPPFFHSASVNWLQYIHTHTIYTRIYKALRPVCKLQALHLERPLQLVKWLHSCSSIRGNSFKSKPLFFYTRRVWEFTMSNCFEWPVAFRLGLSELYWIYIWMIKLVESDLMSGLFWTLIVDWLNWKWYCVLYRCLNWTL